MRQAESIVSLVAALVALALTAAGVGAAFAREPSQQSPGITSQAPRKLAGAPTKACPDMARANAITLNDGGTLNAPQGWLYKTSVQNAPNGWTYLICYYGIHARQELRANNPVYEVAYPIPGFRAEQCAVNGNAATCSR